jgi:hypothetical protein
MGMYTSVRFHAQLNSDGRLVCRLLSYHRERNGGEEWRKVAETIRDGSAMSQALDQYAALPRAEFIPYGALMLDKWAPLVDRAPGFNVRATERAAEHGIWTIACSLKNYSGEVEAFTRLLAHLIVVPCEVQSWYEDDFWATITRVEPVATDSTKRQRTEAQLVEALKEVLEDESDPF